MALEFEYDGTKKILYFTVRGIFTIAEFYATAPDVLNSDEFPPNANSLWDLREMDLQGFDAEFMKRIVQVRKEFPERGNAHLALLVQGDLAYGMSRMYEMLSDTETTGLQQRIRVFRDFAAAEQWLLDNPI